MTENSVMEPTSDEKLFSAVAYFFGFLGATVVWILQKERSRFVRFHATQALAFDFVVMVTTSAIFFCVFGVVFAGTFGTMFVMINASSPPDGIPLLILSPLIMPFMIFTCVLPFTLVLTIIRIIAVVSVLGGRDFRYPWLGRQIEKFLGD